MTDNIIKFPADVTPDEVLSDSKGCYQEIIIVGWDEEGTLYIRGTVSSSDAVMLLELAKHTFMQEAFGEDYSVN